MITNKDKSTETAECQLEQAREDWQTNRKWRTALVDIINRTNQ